MMEEKKIVKKKLNQDLVELGKNIQKQREFCEMSQEDLALEIGTNAAAICKYETAQRYMKVERLYEIADVLMVTPNDLGPERFNSLEGQNPRLLQLREKLKRLSPEKQAAAYHAMEAMLTGFLAME